MQKIAMFKKFSAFSFFVGAIIFAGQLNLAGYAETSRSLLGHSSSASQRIADQEQSAIPNHRRFVSQSYLIEAPEPGESQQVAFETPDAFPEPGKTFSLDGQPTLREDGNKEVPIGTKSHLEKGERFPVVVSTHISSKSAKKGDAIEAKLKDDLRIGNRLVATKGSVVHGHVNYSLKARTGTKAFFSKTRWFKNSGCLGISFDEIVNETGDHFPLIAGPAKQARIVKDKEEGRLLGINQDGQITGPWSTQIKYAVMRAGISAAMAPAGVFSFGAAPAALGVIGAINPSFAFGKPIGKNVKHRRIKGFFWGAVQGAPGGFIIQQTFIHGQEAVIVPGDEFLAELKEDFTGQPSMTASAPPASTEVHGEVLPVIK